MTEAAPGYGTAARAEDRGQAAAPVLYFWVLLVAGAVALVWETAARQPSAYLDPEGGPPRWAATLAAGIGAIGGLVAGARPLAMRPRDRLPWLLLVTSLVAMLSATWLFFAFAAPGWFELGAVLVPALAMGLLAASLRTSVRAFRPAAGLDVLGHALRPFRLVLLVVLLAAAATVASRLGLLRSAAAVGLGFAVLAHWSPALFAFLHRQPLAHARGIRNASRAQLGACLGLFALSEVWVPTSELGQYENEIVYARTGPYQRVVITSGQESFGLFVEDKLKITTIDEQRYSETLVHPAMAVASHRRRVAVLGAGDGLSEREILRYPDVQQITVVVVDGTLAELATRMPWLRRRTAGSMLSPKVTVVEQEPIVWLGETQAEFDVMFVDLPDPIGFIESKSYTRYFYQKLSERLPPDGVAAIQATSAFRSPQTFASIQRTIAAAGLSTLPYRAPVPVLGEWGFVLAAHRPMVPPAHIRDDLAFLDQTRLTDLFHLPPDLRSSAPAVLSTLERQPLVEIFDREHSGAQ